MKKIALFALVFGLLALSVPQAEARHRRFVSNHRHHWRHHHHGLVFRSIVGYPYGYPYYACYGGYPYYASGPFLSIGFGGFSGGHRHHHHHWHH